MCGIFCLIEKNLLRKAFDNKLLPDAVLWRKKEAFSDGVSKKEKSWYSIIQDYITTQEINKASRLMSQLYDDCDNDCYTEYGYDSPLPTKREAIYYRERFIEYFGKDNVDIIPNYWQPKWDANGEVRAYVDPSARTLNVYN